MDSIHVRRRAIACCGLLLATLTASSCGDRDNDRPKVAGQKTKTIKCDNDITVNPDGPKPASVYLCDGDTLTWKKGKGTDGFDIDFGNRTPFFDGYAKFSDDKPSHPGQPQYGPLDVYKYTIVVRSGGSTTKLDPQVVTGGNQ